MNRITDYNLDTNDSLNNRIEILFYIILLSIKIYLEMYLEEITPINHM